MLDFPDTGAFVAKPNPIITRGEQVLFANYARFPIAIKKGRDCRVFDWDDNSYLDFVAGIAVTSLGHCHPKVTVAVQKQAQRLVHCSNLYYNAPMVELAEALVAASFGDKVFFCNSGAEANEAAIKLARKAMGPNRYEIITVERSFHGRTMLTVAATGQDKVKEGFSPIPPGFVHVPFDDVDAMEQAITDRTAAIMVEPILGEGGVLTPSPGYLAALRKLCDRHGILLIYDEIQTGMVRCGTLFGYQADGVAPDLMTLAKGLGNGVPIGALIATERTAKAFVPGTHGSTFGGGPLACAAALAVIQTIQDDPWILENTNAMGDKLRTGLTALSGRFPHLTGVRGKGLLIGAQLDVPARPVAEACMAGGLLVSLVGGGDTIRFSPPLTVREADVDEALTIFAKALGEAK